jgi:hypothetical protein
MRPGITSRAKPLPPARAWAADRRAAFERDDRRRGIALLETRRAPAGERIGRALRDDVERLTVALAANARFDVARVGDGDERRAGAPASRFDHARARGDASLTSGTPASRCPPYRARSTTVSPNISVWSSDTLVMIAGLGLEHVRAVERTADPDLDHRYVDAGLREVRRTPAPAAFRNTTGRPYSGASPAARASSRRAAAELFFGDGAPSMRARSVIELRCGLVCKPVTRPEAVSAAAIIVQVEPLPLVPPTWIVGYCRCGSPRLRTQRRHPLEPLRIAARGGAR